MPRTRPSSRLVRAADALPRAFAASPRGADDDGPDPVAEAYEKGLRDGRAAIEAGSAEALERRTEALRSELSAALRRLAAAEEERRRALQARMVELALEAASTIARARVEAEDPVAARALAQAVDALPAGDRVTARIHPDDRGPIERELADEVERGRIELIADESVGRGGCLVESPAGTVDARLETAIEAVRSAAEGRSEAT